MARTVAGHGASAPVVMRPGGWQSLAMVARYTRKLAAKEAMRFLQAKIGHATKPPSPR